MKKISEKRVENIPVICYNDHICGFSVSIIILKSAVKRSFIRSEEPVSAKVIPDFRVIITDRPLPSGCIRGCGYSAMTDQIKEVIL